MLIKETICEIKFSNDTTLTITNMHDLKHYRCDHDGIDRTQIEESKCKIAEELFGMKRIMKCENPTEYGRGYVRGLERAIQIIEKVKGDKNDAIK